MLSCTRTISFDAGHRLINHESKCKYLHGHRYYLDVTFVTTELDSVGRVIDFGEVKEILGAWVNQNWDHNMILWEKDKELGENIRKATSQNIYYLPYNPTCENMAKYLMENVMPKLFAKFEAKVVKLTLRETPNCYVEVTA